ncbi:MAG: HAD family phosphatase [Elusimicrobiota bacterium]
MNSIKAVIFDLGNVILYFDHQKSLSQFAALTGHTSEEYGKYIFEAGLKNEFDTGKIEPEEFYNKISIKFGLKISLNEFKQIWGNIFWLNTDAESVINKLSGRIKLYLLSNTDALHYEYFMANYPILQKLDKCYTSFGLKRVKPDPRIYEFVLKDINCRPEDVVYIDDCKEFIMTAKKIGINTIHYIDNVILAPELLNYGVVV